MLQVDGEEGGETVAVLHGCMWGLTGAFRVSCVCSVAQSRLTLCDPMNGSSPGSSVHGFSRQEYWSGLPFSPPGDLPDPGIKPASSAFPALTGGFFTTVPPGKPVIVLNAAELYILIRWTIWDVNDIPVELLNTKRA